jgi:hypothetical protein
MTIIFKLLKILKTDGRERATFWYSRELGFGEHERYSLISQKELSSIFDTLIS